MKKIKITIVLLIGLLFIECSAYLGYTPSGIDYITIYDDNAYFKIDEFGVPFWEKKYTNLKLPIGKHTMNFNPALIKKIDENFTHFKKAEFVVKKTENGVVVRIVDVIFTPQSANFVGAYMTGAGNLFGEEISALQTMVIKSNSGAVVFTKSLFNNANQLHNIYDKSLRWYAKNFDPNNYTTN